MEREPEKAGEPSDRGASQTPHGSEGGLGGSILNCQSCPRILKPKLAAGGVPCPGVGLTLHPRHAPSLAGRRGLCKGSSWGPRSMTRPVFGRHQGSHHGQHRGWKFYIHNSSGIAAFHNSWGLRVHFGREKSPRSPAIKKSCVQHFSNRFNYRACFYRTILRNRI